MTGELRASAEKLMERAADAGMTDAARLLHMTPAEIGWELRAFVRQQERNAELLAQVAWLMGRYAMIGLYAPKKYPPMPRNRRGDMTDAEMKEALMRAVGSVKYEHST